MAKCGADLTSKKPYTSINTTLSIYPNTLISVENELNRCVFFTSDQNAVETSDSENQVTLDK